MQDFHGPSQADFIDGLGRSLAATGFVVVTGHSLGSQQLDRCTALAQTLFALPESAKRAYHQPGSATGYTPFGLEHSRDNPQPDLKEFWHVGREANPWPPEIPHFQPEMMALYQGLERCAEQLLEALALYLDLPRRALADLIVDGDSILRLLHYPPLGRCFQPGGVRASAHEDINFITLLPQATASGLEMRDQQGQWHPITATNGDLIVDVGDMLSRHLNFKIPSTTHRVVNPTTLDEARYSMPFFVHPRPAVLLGGITAQAFLQQRLRENGML